MPEYAVESAGTVPPVEVFPSYVTRLHQAEAEQASDRDGVSNIGDRDDDGDGKLNYLDSDDDNDGIPTVAGTVLDTDLDGVRDYRDLDDDGDLDLVITVDTSMGHLTGALGKPVWIMIPKAADWRWLLDRDDTPWYPTARLFRSRWTVRGSNSRTGMRSNFSSAN